MPTSLSPRAVLALRLGAGALVLVVTAWLFGAIAEDVVTSDRITTLDAQLASWLHVNSDAGLIRLMFAVSALHSTVAISAYGAVAALVLGLRRRWRWLVTVALCMAGGMTVNVLMKLAFHRARPVFDDPLLTLTTYSFPSGHVAASTIFYGLLVCWVFARTRTHRWRLLALAGAALGIGLVAMSRMVLGAHYLSDVAAAFVEGIAWMALCLTGLEAFWRHTGSVAATRVPEAAAS